MELFPSSKASCTTRLLEFAECPKHSAKGIKHSANGSPSVTLDEQHSPKKVTAKPTLPSVFYRALGKAFAECPTLDKVETEKTPKKWEFLPKKNGIFFIDGGPHRPAPTHLRHFSREFYGYAADAIRTRDSRPPAVHVPPLPLHHTLTCVWIPF